MSTDPAAATPSPEGEPSADPVAQASAYTSHAAAPAKGAPKMSANDPAGPPIPGPLPSFMSPTVLDTTDGSTTEALYRAAIGPQRVDYYLKAFTRFDAANRVGPRWNTAAALCTLNWMVYRRLWLAALVYAGLAASAFIMIFGMGSLIFDWSRTDLLSLGAALAAVAVLVPGFYGNALLHKSLRKKMGQALTSTKTLAEACTMLQQKAPGRKRLITLAVLNGLVVSSAAGAYVALPHMGKLATTGFNTDALHELVGGRIVGLALPGDAAPQATTQPGAHTAPPQAVPQTTPTAQADTHLPASAAVVAPTAAPPKKVTIIASNTAAANAKDNAPNPTPAPAAHDTPVPVAPPAKAKAKPVKVTPTAAKEATHEAAKEATPIAAPAAPAATEKIKENSPAAPVKTDDAAPPSVARKAPAAAEAPVAAPANAVFYINVGLFKIEDNANRAFAKLQMADLPVFTQIVESPTKGRLVRVRVGPYKTRAQADDTAAKIKAQGLDALVIAQ